MSRPTRFLDDVLERHRDSDATAVVDVASDESVSYRTLAGRVGALSEHLADLGVGRHDTVAMVLDKSVDAVVCMWATLRLGARYVPVDESLPQARVAQVLSRCRPAVTVVHPAHRALVGPSEVVLVADRDRRTDADRAWDPTAESALGPPTVDRDPADAAYVIFTSGSTGGPKGVVIGHRAAAALLDGVQQVVGFDGETRYLNVAPLFFDASLVDLFSTFLVGGTVHLLPRLRMATQITQACERWRITDTLLVPSVIRMLVGRFSDLPSRDLSALRRLWFGGESCPVSLLRAVDARLPGLQYVHGYGPTETTHSATLHLTDDIASYDGEFLPIGSALPAVDLLVVDDQLRPVPPGETGELLIGGAQTMDGYCDDPVRTGEVLVTGPDGARYYRSGDLVCRRPDGALMFLGRRDDAVKVNGNLVHLSEVDAAALAVEWVSDCCAVPVDHPVGGRTITLFVIGTADGDGAGGDLRQTLAATLPEYMVPTRIEIVDDGDVALTASGKLDRDHLRTTAGLRDR